MTTILSDVPISRREGIDQRFPNETLQTLVSLGAASPNFPQRLYLASLARDRDKDIEIRCTYHLEDDEISEIDNNAQAITIGIIQARFGQSFANPAGFVQFLSSMDGRRAQDEIGKELQVAIEKLKVERKMIVGFHAQVRSSVINAIDVMSGAFLTFLDQRHPPQVSAFSFFPADRALPVGEVPVQLGAADTQQQLESHNSQPQLKYTRLKNLIFNSLVMMGGDRKQTIQEFENIFQGILKGRSIHSIGVNDIGLLSVQVRESDSGRIYEIDSMSSGEKGLLLTFLLISKTVVPGGIVLLDEPELHLNPAVCRELLDFMIDTYAKPKRLQFVVCSHSPEILAGAFDREECTLLHIVSEQVISPVGKSAPDEVSDALRQLGASVTDALLYKGTILVEGDGDVVLLQDGFSQRLKRYQIKPLGGRSEIEKAIRKLQNVETGGGKSGPVLFIFDKDKAPSNLRNSETARFIQWNRYCIENYMIDPEILTALLKDPDLVRTPIPNQGTLTNILRQIAMSQLNGHVAASVYKKFGYRSPTYRAEDLDGASLEEIAAALFARFSEARSSLNRYSDEDWKHQFVRLCNEERATLEPIWDGSWRELCNGKRLFSDLHKKANLRVPLRAFKRRIIQSMRVAQSDDWRAMDSLIRGLIGDPS